MTKLKIERPKTPNASNNKTPSFLPSITTTKHSIFNNKGKSRYDAALRLPTLHEIPYESYAHSLVDEIKARQIDQILLVAEDSAPIMKSLRLKIKKLITDLMTSGQHGDQSWGNHGIAWDITAHNAIVYVGNGSIAQCVLRLLPAKSNVVLVSDQQMPEICGTDLINAALRSANPPKSIALHTSLNSEDPEIFTFLNSHPEVVHIKKPNDSIVMFFIQEHHLSHTNITEQTADASSGSISPKMF